MNIRPALLLCLSILLAVPSAFAWGHVGHATVADIAEARLTPQAAQAVQQLLAVEHYKHLSDISSWADLIKKQHLAASPAHSIRLPLDHSDTVPPHACPSGYCAVQGINDYCKQLADKSLPLAQREIALKYVVHLVGDLHQPLHATEATGRLPVIFNGKERKLHWVWDDGIIYSQGHDPAKLAAALSDEIDESNLYFGGNPGTWALESRNIARDDIYKALPVKSAQPIKLPPDYAEKNWPVVKDRLIQAGVRLANLLNKALS